MLKKIALLFSAFAGMIVLGGCGESASDPQSLLREALGNAFTVESTKFDSTLDVQFENVEETSGNINLVFAGKGENILEFPPILEYSLGANFNLENAELGAIAGELELGFKMLEEAFFGIIEKVELSGSPEMEAAKPFIQSYLNNWYRFSLSEITGMEEQMEEQKEMQKEILAIYKKLLTENDILLVESLSENSGNYILEIAPNFDLIFSRDFIENDLLGAMKIAIENSTFDEAEMDLDDETLDKLPEIRGTAEKIWKLGNFKLEIHIDKNDRIARSSAMSGEIDLAEFGKLFDDFDNEDATGKIIFDITSTLSEINQSQNIVPPAEFIDLDPTMMFGMPMDAPMDEINLEDDFGEFDEEMMGLTPDELEAMFGEGSLEMELPEDAPIARPRN